MFESSVIGSLPQSANRSLPPGAGFALLGLAGLAAMLRLGKQRLPRLRPAYAVGMLAVAINLLGMGGITAGSSCHGGSNDPTIEPCPLWFPAIKGALSPTREPVW